MCFVNTSCRIIGIALFHGRSLNKKAGETVSSRHNHIIVIYMTRSRSYIPDDEPTNIRDKLSSEEAWPIHDPDSLRIDAWRNVRDDDGLVGGDDDDRVKWFRVNPWRLSRPHNIMYRVCIIRILYYYYHHHIVVLVLIYLFRLV